MDEWKTSFSTTTVRYHYQMMPYGLASAPIFFLNMINDVLHDFLNKIVIHWQLFDLLPRFPKWCETYSSHLANSIYCKIAYCDTSYTLRERSVNFIKKKFNFWDRKHWHWPHRSIYGREQGQSCPNMAKPTDSKGFAEILGFSNFYCRFIRNYSIIASPLTSSTKRGRKRLVWRAFKN